MVTDGQVGRWKITLTAILSAVLFFVATFIVGALASWLANSITDSAIALNAIPLFVGSLVVSAVLLKVPPSSSFAALGLDRESVKPTVIGLALGGGICAAIVIAMLLAGSVVWTEVDVFAIRFDWRGSVGTGLLLLAIGAAGEELFVRGYFLQQLGRALSPVGAIAVTSIVFALLHASNPGTTWIATVNTALYGGVFGLAVLWHRSLWMSFGIHYAWNCAEALLGANISGLTIRLTELNLESRGADWLTGGAYGPEAGLVGTVGALAMAAALWMLPRREGMPKLLWEIDREATNADDATFSDDLGRDVTVGRQDGEVDAGGEGTPGSGA